jgi:hypothetical protein
MSHKLNSAIAVIGIDIGKNSFHVVGHDKASDRRARGARAVSALPPAASKHWHRNKTSRGATTGREQMQ